MAEDTKKTTEDTSTSSAQAEKKEVKKKNAPTAEAKADVSTSSAREKEEVVKKKEEKKSATTKAKANEKKSIPELKPGMTVRVYQKIKEMNIKGEEKERVQYFEGMIIAKKHGKETGGTITLRKISNGIEVEKIFPLNLPTITKIEIKKQAEVKRAKLYFLKRGYKKKLKETKVN